MSKHNIRLLTTKEGIETLKTFLNKDEFRDTMSDLMTKTDINKEYDKFIYVGWERLNLRMSNLIKDIILELEAKDITYRLAEMNNEFAEVEEISYTSEKDKDKFFPYPSVIHTFDDNEMFVLLEQYANTEKNNDKETIDYE